MYPNLIICDSIAAQYRQERLHEATAERNLTTMRNEQQNDRQHLHTTEPTRNMIRLWDALYSFVSSLA